MRRRRRLALGFPYGDDESTKPTAAAGSSSSSSYFYHSLLLPPPLLSSIPLPPPLPLSPISLPPTLPFLSSIFPFLRLLLLVLLLLIVFPLHAPIPLLPPSGVGKGGFGDKPPSIGSEEKICLNFFIQCKNKKII